MTKKAEEPSGAQVTMDELHAFLEEKLDPEDLKKVNKLLVKLVVGIASESYRNGLKAAYR